MLVACANGRENLRVAVIAGGRVGGAVQRNRVKRQMRAVIHALLPTLKPGRDLLFIARQPMVQAPFAEIQLAISQLARRAGLLLLPEDDSLSASGLSE